MTKKKPFAQKRKFNPGKAASHAWRKKRWQMKEKTKAQQQQNLTKCAVCCVEIAKTKVTEHNQTELHKELLEVKHHWLSEGRFHKTLDEQIEKKGSDMPFVGLQYMVQYQPNEKGEHTYQCRLCNGVYRPRASFYHVLSIQHRILYLARHHKSMGVDKKFQVNSREQYMHLMTCTANAFQIDGKKPIKIVDEVYVPKVEPEPAPSVKPNKNRGKKPEAKAGPTGIGMDVINHALARLQQKRGVNTYLRSVNQQRAEINRRALGRNPGSKNNPRPPQPQPQPEPRNRTSSKQEDLLELLSAFLDARKDGDPSMQLYDDGRPAMMQEGPMSHEGAAFRQADINAPGILTPGVIVGRPNRPGMPPMAKPGAAQPTLPQHSTVLRHPPATIPFVKGDQERSLDLPVSHEVKMREMEKSEDLNSGSVGEKDPSDSNWFWCNEELYDFLGHLRVENKIDVDNVLKATDLFANALVRHKQRTDDIKKWIEEEKKTLEMEKKAFLNAPGVNLALQKKERVKSKSRSPSPERGAATKRKATTECSSSNKPLFPIGSTPATTEPPSKAKRTMTLSFDSYRPSASARKRTPPRRVSDTKNKQAEARSGNRPAFGNKAQAPARKKTPPRRVSDTKNKPAEARPGDRPAFGNKTQGSTPANPNPSEQRKQGSQLNQSGPLARQRPGLGYGGQSAGNTNPSSQQRMPGSQFAQSGPSADQRPAFGQASNRLQASTNPSQQRIPGLQFSESDPSSDQRPAYGEASNRPQGFYPGSSTANTNASQQQMKAPRFSQVEPPSDQTPAFGQNANRPQGFYTGPSTANSNPSQQRMPGSQFSQSGPSSGPRMGVGQTSNRPQGPAAANVKPSQQRMSGAQFNQSRPTSDPGSVFDPQDSESKFPKSPGRFAPKGLDEDLGMRQPFSGSMPAFNQPRQPMQKPASDQSRTQMNETIASWNELRQTLDRSWPSTTGSRNPALEGFRSPTKGAEPSEKRSQVNQPKPPMNKRESEMPVKELRSWQQQLQKKDESRPNDSEPNFESRPSWQEQRGPSKDQYSNVNNPKSLFTEQRQPLNQTRSLSNQPRPSFNEQRLSSHEPSPPFNESRSNQGRPSYGASDSYTESAYYKGDERYIGSQFANSGSAAGARSSYRVGAGTPEESDAYYPENESYASSQYSNTGSTGGAKPSYGVGAARQGESDAYYKENERFAGSQYGNSGTATGPRSSYGPGAGRPQESDAFYKENEKFTGSQYGSTGPTGGAKSSYGLGAGRPGESDSYYTENERFTNAQYGNSGSTGGARPSYGAGAGRPEESDAYYKESERFTNSPYGAAGGAKSSYGTGAGGIEGSKDNYGYSSGFVVAYPLKYSSSTAEPQNSQRPASLGSLYGMNQGSWSTSVPARSDNFPSKGSGAGNVQQQPYSSNQGTMSYDESWK